eukprot:gene19384-biopygen11528
MALYMCCSDRGEGNQIDPRTCWSTGNVAAQSCAERKASCIVVMFGKPLTARGATHVLSEIPAVRNATDGTRAAHAPHDIDTQHTTQNKMPTDRSPVRPAAPLSPATICQSWHRAAGCVCL